MDSKTSDAEVVKLMQSYYRSELVPLDGDLLRDNYKPGDFVTRAMGDFGTVVGVIGDRVFVLWSKQPNDDWEALIKMYEDFAKAFKNCDVAW